MVSLVFGQTSIFSLASFHSCGTRRTTSRGRGHKRSFIQPGAETPRTLQSLPSGVIACEPRTSCERQAKPVEKRLIPGNGLHQRCPGRMAAAQALPVGIDDVGEPQLRAKAAEQVGPGLSVMPCAAGRILRSIALMLGASAGTDAGATPAMVQIRSVADLPIQGRRPEGLASSPIGERLRACLGLFVVLAIGFFLLVWPIVPKGDRSCHSGILLYNRWNVFLTSAFPISSHYLIDPVIHLFIRDSWVRVSSESEAGFQVCYCHEPGAAELGRGEDLLAIQRRTVRIDIPVSRQSRRRGGTPCRPSSLLLRKGEGVWGNQSLAAARSIRGPLGEQAGARSRSARLGPNWRFLVSWASTAHNPDVGSRANTEKKGEWNLFLTASVRQNGSDSVSQGFNAKRLALGVQRFARGLQETNERTSGFAAISPTAMTEARGSFPVIFL